MKALGSIGRVLLVKVREGSKPHQFISEVLEGQGIRLAWINGIGGFKWARIGYFDPSRRVYETVDVEAPEGRVIEVASLLGNSVQGPDGTHYVHIHVSLGVDQGRTIAGHLVDAEVEPFLEVLVMEVVGGLEEARRLFSHRWSH
ncbi:MAG: DUF296 domain-containing protein [Desulfurococcales archaeon]|nr:DUF296 domain-containing protein [Desulfurococcales archaeon]